MSVLIPFTRTDSRERREGAAARPLPTGARGFTLVEVTIILMVVSVLSTILLPGIGGYLRDARLARARGDMEAIAESIGRFLADTAEGAFRCYGNGNRKTASDGPSDPSSPDPWYVVGMLVSDGDIPDSGDGDELWKWRRAVDGHDVDTLANHLVQNTPGGRGDLRYRTPEDLLVDTPNRQFAFPSQRGFNAKFSWRGPYLSAPVRSDPWGNRYAVNVKFLDAVSDSDHWHQTGWVEDVFVLSAGPDEELDTPYLMDGVVPGDDDLVRVIAGGSR